MASLQDLERLQFCGVTVDPSPRHTALQVGHPELQREEEVAGLAGEFALKLVNARMHRLVWMVQGWPSLSVLFYSSVPGVADRCKGPG